MGSFPDTVFRVCGYLPITVDGYGSAVVVFESMENKGSYFSQFVECGKIYGFIEFSFDFNLYEQPVDEFFRLGSDAVCCFITRTAVIIKTKNDLQAYLRNMIKNEDLRNE
jgi:hypothetical protein